MRDKDAVLVMQIPALQGRLEKVTHKMYAKYIFWQYTTKWGEAPATNRAGLTDALQFTI